MAVTLADIQTAANTVWPNSRAHDNVTTQFPQGVWLDMNGRSWTMNFDKAVLNTAELPTLIRAAFASRG